MKNNNIETIVVIIAILHLIKNKNTKVRVKTDSQYVEDLYNDNYLTKNKVKYENYALLFFVNLNSKVTNHGVPGFSLKIKHMPGHSQDFGNLEID